MNLAKFSVERPITVGMVSFALLVLGLFTVSRMPVSLYPDVSFPFVSVVVPYPGASPEQIENTVLKPLEKQLAGVKKLSRVISYSRNSIGTVILAFKMSADERESVDIVRERVAFARSVFPTGTKDPIVQRVDVGATPILIFGVETNAKTTSEISATKKQLEDGIVRELQRTEGVGEASVLGLGEERIQLSLNFTKLNSLRVSPLEVYEQLSTKMAVVPWGDVKLNDKLVPIARSFLPETKEYWEQQNVNLKDGRGIRLNEIGEIEFIQEDTASGVIINGQKGLGLVITKRSDANTVDAVKKVSKVIEKYQLPENIKIFPILDQSKFIQENAHEVWIALFIGGAFAVVIIFLFLTDIKSALISATALPVSVAGAFIFMNYLGFSLNMMSLLALALAIGLLIDDAVVVRESIYSELEQGKSGKEASILGTQKVASAVLATTLAVVAVFLPVGLMSGLVGQFFKQFGITICISVIISLWVAFTLDPMLSAYFAGKPKPLQGTVWNRWRNFLKKTEEFIAQIASFSFKHPYLILFSSIFLLLGSLALVFSRGADFVAYEDRGQFVVDAKVTVGTPKEQVEVVAKEISERLKKLEGRKDTYCVVGAENEQNRIICRLVFNAKTERKLGLLKIQEEARKKLEGLNAKWLLLEPPAIEGIGGEAPVTVFIYGENLVSLLPVAQKLRDEMLKIPGLVGARIDNENFGESFNINYKTDELALQGTNSQAIELSGRLALTGLEAGNVGAENKPFYLRLQPLDRNLESLWSSLLIPTMRGPTPLQNFATAEKEIRPLSIDREKRIRKFVISGSLDRTETFGVVLQNVQKLVDKVEKPFFAEVGGDKEVFEEMVTSFSLAIIGSLFFIFIILAAQFENLFRPFVILLSLPLAMIGGFLALYLAGEQIAMGALIGLILLIGLAAKNGILLVDAIGQKEKTTSLSLAVYQSVLERTRPILMTSIAMIFGMIPTAVMRGGGSEFRSPMAIAIIGGVVSSTLLSFLVVPAIFGLIHTFSKKNKIVKINSVATTVLCLLLFTSLNPSKVLAQETPQKQAQSTNWKQFVASLPTPDSSKESVKSAEAAAEGAQKSSRLAFVGGLRVEAARVWSRPGLTNSLIIPLPSNNVEVSNVIVPKQQNEFSIGWGIPLFNWQALAGISLAKKLQEQSEILALVKKEEIIAQHTELFLKASLAYKQFYFQEIFEKNALARLNTIQQKKAVGLASKFEEIQAEGALQAAIAKKQQQESELNSQLATFKSLTTVNLEPHKFNSLLVTFADEVFKPNALALYEKIFQVETKNTEITSAASLPKIQGEIGYGIKKYPTSPAGQTQLALRAQWDIFDAGATKRNTTQAQLAASTAKTKFLETQEKMQAQFESLPKRKIGLLQAFKSAEKSLELTSKAQKIASDNLGVGLAKASDLRDADEQILKAQLQKLEIEFALHGLAIESHLFAGSLTNYVQ
jgi:hydrophobic/amphiphilic exporter-1 (mainly G- bacteria), HAE1 family